jgi:NADH-quinone oxidoreductase subunit N
MSSINIFNLLKNFLILIFLICLIIICYYYKIEKYLRFEFFYIFGLSFVGMLLLILSNDLIIMFLSLELQTFGLYILLGIQQKR